MMRMSRRRIGLSVLLLAWLGTPITRAGKAPADPPTSPGRYALQFDGKTSFVWLGQPIPDELPKGTAEVWFRLDEPWENGAQRPLIGDDAGCLNLVLRDNHLAFNKDGGGSRELSWAPARLTAGWHHVAGVWGEGGMKLFVDGKLVASHPDDEKPYKRSKLPYDIVPVETRLGLARIWWGDLRYHRFAGQMAFLRISRKRLYEQDFTPRIDAPAESSADLVRYDFAEGRGNVLKDSSGQGHDALIAGCSWKPLKTVPRIEDGVIEVLHMPEPAEAPVVVLPFTCHPEMVADVSELEGFQLTTAWLLNTLGELPVTTEDRSIELAPPAAPPYRGQFPDHVLSRARRLAFARAVVHGYVEPAPGHEPGDRSAPARLTIRVLRPGPQIWRQTIPIDAQSLAGYGRAQRAAARAVFEQLAPEDRQDRLSALADQQDVPEPVRELWQEIEDHLRAQDTFALLRATADAAEAVRLEPRRPESWRLLAESYAWLGGSPSRNYSSVALSALSRARAAHNLALLLSEPTPEIALTGALIDRFVPDYLGARASALRLTRPEPGHDWTPEQELVLALATGEQSRMPRTVPGQPALEPLVRGRIRELNGRSPGAVEDFETAWERNPRASSAPVLIANSRAGSGLGTLRRLSQQALAPGLTQASRILAWDAARRSEPVAEFLRSLAQTAGQPAPDLADAHDPEAVDRAALQAAGEDRWLDDDQALRRIDVLMDFDRRLVANQRAKTLGILTPGQAPAPDSHLVARLARAEAESGFDVQLRLLVVMLGVPEESVSLLRPLVLACGYDTMTAHWAEKFVARYRSYKGKLPWPPALGHTDLEFAPGYLDMIYAEPTYQPYVYRDARRRFPYWDVPLREQQKPAAYLRNPYDERNVRLWVLPISGKDRLRRLQRVQDDAPESTAARRVAAEIWLRDPLIGDERRGIEILKALIAEEPDAPAPYRELAAYLLESGRPDEAVQWYGKLADRPLASLVPISALLRIASIERGRHQPERERAVLAEAVQSFKEDAVTAYARALAEAGEIEQATALYEAARQRYAPGAGILAREAAALFHADRQAQARQLVVEFVRAQPYNVGSLAATRYYQETEDADTIVKVQGRLGWGRAGRLVLTRAYLKRNQTEDALKTARSAQNQGQISHADQPDDPVEAAELLARALGARYVALRAADKPDEARTLLADFARTETLTHLAALLSPIATAEVSWVPEALNVLAESAQPHDPALPAARSLADCPRLGETYRDQLAQESRHRFGPDNRLRLAVREILHTDALPADQARSLASALLSLNPTSTWASQQAAVFQRAFGPESRGEFLKQVDRLELSSETAEIYRRVAASWPDWHLLGPFPDDRLDGLRRPYLDETGPIDPEQPVAFEGTDRRWVRPWPDHTWGGLSLAVELAPTDGPAVSYAYREIETQKADPSHFVLEGPQSARVFLNGQELSLWIYSPGIADRLELELPLKAGTNRLLLKLRYPKGASSCPLFVRFGASAEAPPTESKPESR